MGHHCFLCKECAFCVHYAFFVFKPLESGGNR